MVLIRKIDKTNDVHAAANVLRHANATVAADLGFTQENAPSNPAFINADTLRKQITVDRAFYVLEKENIIIGTVAFEKSLKEKDTFYIERLAILPEHRHYGYGKMLMKFAMEQVRKERGTRVSIGIINENTILKEWYISLGFSETGIKKFSHLPFTVCFLAKELI